MPITPTRPTLCSALALALLFSAGSALAATLDLPVWTPGRTLTAPYYRGDVIEVQLTPAAARALAPRGSAPLRSERTARLGLASLDAAAARAGVQAFAPEFRDERAPESADEPDFTAFHLAHLAEGADLATALDELRASPDVLRADPVAVLPVSAALPDDSLAFASYWLYRDKPARTDIRAPEAWQVTTGDTSIVVAVLDTGILPNHPDLSGRGERGNLWVNWIEKGGVPLVDDDGNGYVDDVNGWDFVVNGTTPALGEDFRDEDNDPNDWAGHGTAVSGVLGALAGNGIGLAGVAPTVRIMNLRMGWLQSGGLPPSGLVDMTYAANAIRYATRNGAHVLNCSWQSQNTGGLDAAVTAAVRAGIVVVNAAGNGGTPFTYLGQRPDIISVAAVDSFDVVWPGSVVGPWVDLSAAGAGIVSTIMFRGSLDSLGGRRPSYQGFINGTSFASPQVAGAVALLQAERRRQGLDPFTPAGALLRLRETTDDIRPLNTLVTSGFGTGRLNLFRALTDPTGSLAIRTRARAVGPPAVLSFNTGRSLVVQAMSDRTLLATDGATGDTVWTAPMPGPIAGNLAVSEGPPGVGAIVAGATTNGSLFVMREDGRPLPPWPQVLQAGMNLSGGVAIGDVDGEGTPDLVVAGTTLAGSRVFAYDFSGAPLAGFPFDPGVIGASAPALADLDGVTGDEIAFVDGAGALRVVGSAGVERTGFPVGAAAAARAPVVMRLGGPAAPLGVVLAGTGAVQAYRGDASLAWSAPITGSPSQDPALADLDGDGRDELLLLTSAPQLVVLDSAGTPFTARPGWPATLSIAPQGPLVVGPLAAAHGPCALWFTSSGLTALDDSAHVLATFPKPGGAGQSPSLADLDGDGATEVAAGTALADSNSYTYDAGAGTWNASFAHWPTPRGDQARRASHAAGNTPAPAFDRVRPAPVGDLIVTATGTTSALVTFTASGDDSLSGTASAHVLRRSLTPLDDFTFASGIPVPPPPAAPPGTPVSWNVTGLPEGSKWWFALRTVDDAGNRSAVSNSDSLQLPGFPPGTIGDVRVLAVAESTVVIAWTAPGDDGNSGRPLGYHIAASTQAIPDVAAFDAAPLQLQRPAFRDAGSGETLSVRHLTPGRRWRFAVRAEDHGNALGDLSNVAEAVTPVGGALHGRAGLALAPRPMPATAGVTVDWQGDASGTVESALLVYDLHGRELRRVSLGREPGGSYQWDGRDGAQRLLPAGLYFLRLSCGARHADSRVVFVR